VVEAHQGIEKYDMQGCMCRLLERMGQVVPVLIVYLQWQVHVEPWIQDDISTRMAGKKKVQKMDGGEWPTDCTHPK
jgi:hypothetical protein